MSLADPGGTPLHRADRREGAKPDPRLLLSPTPAPAAAAQERLAAVIQVAICLAFSQWHLVARFLVAGETGAATRNALQLIDVETALGLYREASLQQFVLARPLLAQAATFVYSLGHSVVPVCALIVLWRWDRQRYRYWRNVLACMCALAIGVFALWPLMPPRLLPPEYGFVDLLALDPVVDLARPLGPALANDYAAMPSLHMGFAMWSCLALLERARSRVGRGLLLAYPVLMSLAVVATGNHYFLDIAGGAAVLAAAMAVTRRSTGQRAGDPATRGWLRDDQRLARRVQFALIAVILFVWLPKAQVNTALFDAVVLLGVEACLRLHRRAGVPRRNRAFITP
ncbi:MAG: phosphatase PAP2 family protein [Actinomycetota bacterium]|nr:phosphatase PAP2 family protein [Actinomycetota bacterium]